MDYGILLRRRMASSRRVYRLFHEYDGLWSNEQPSDVLISYLLSVVSAKFLASPFEVVSSIAQLTNSRQQIEPLPRPRISSLSWDLFTSIWSFLGISTRYSSKSGRVLVWTSFLLEVMTILPNIMVENIVFLTLIRLHRWFTSHWIWRKQLLALKRQKGEENRAVLTHSPSNLLAYHLQKKQEEEDNSQSISRWLIFCLGIVAKLVAVWATYPLEVLKTRRTLELYRNFVNDEKPTPFSFSASLWNIIEDIYQKNTNLNLGGGLITSLAKVIVYMFIRRFILVRLSRNLKDLGSRTDEFLGEKEEDEQEESGETGRVQKVLDWVFGLNRKRIDFAQRSKNFPPRFLMSSFVQCLFFDYVSCAAADAIVTPLGMMARTLQLDRRAIRKSSAVAIIKHITDISFQELFKVWRSRTEMRWLFVGAKYNLATLFIIWFGTMFSFQFWRIVIRLGKKWIK